MVLEKVETFWNFVCDFVALCREILHVLKGAGNLHT